MLSIAILISLATALSYISIIGLRRWAERHRVLDVPNERSSHTRPVPRGGGLAIVVITLAGVWLYVWLYPTDHLLALLAYTVGALMISVVGWLDDLRSLAAAVRLVIHSLAALLVVCVIGYWRMADVPILDQVHLGWMGLPAAFFWVLGLTNAYNFMDGIDGIAGGQAVVAGCGWVILGWITGQPLPAVLGLLVAGSSLGFLGHNWPPARIFMGDVASGFLGYTLAALPLMAVEREPRLLLAGALLLWPFLYDSIFTFLRRFSRGENVFTAHRSHLYQRLVVAGRSHRFVTSLYVGLALAGAGLSLAWLRGGGGLRAATVLLVPLFCCGLWLYVIREERRKRAEEVTANAAVFGGRV